MFFSLRKKKNLEAEAKAQEQQRIEEEAFQKINNEIKAYATNVDTFYKICDMVRSLPKERQIVVVQRKNIFESKSDRNWCYMKMAKEMRHQYQICGKTWIKGYNGSLYAFYVPTRITPEFRNALNEFSKDGFHIQRIRYYHFNY